MGDRWPHQAPLRRESHMIWNACRSIDTQRNELEYDNEVILDGTECKLTWGQERHMKYRRISVEQILLLELTIMFVERRLEAVSNFEPQGREIPLHDPSRGFGASQNQPSNWMDGIRRIADIMADQR